MNDPDGSPIVFVEWFREDDGTWRPTTVMTERSCYDFQWCEHDGQLLYRDVGSASREAFLAQCVEHTPIRCRVWSTIPLTDYDAKPLSLDQITARGYEVVAECQENPFDDAAPGCAEWCQVCRSYFDSESTCRHIHDCCDGNGFCWGSGSAECDLEATRLSLFRMLRLIPHAAVRTLESIISSPTFTGCRHSDSLLGGDCRLSFQSKQSHVWLYLEPLGQEANHEYRFGPAFKWLYSLDAKTERQNWLTVGWMWQFEHESHSVGAPETTLYYECEQHVIDPFLHRPMDDIDRMPFILDATKLDRNAHTSHFMSHAKATEYVVLVWEDRRVELSVADVNPLGNNLWQFEFGRIVRRDSTDIRTACPHLIVQSHSQPKEPRRARKTVKNS